MVAMDTELRFALEQLNQSDPTNRLAAIEEVSSFAYYFESAGAALVHALQDPNLRVRGRAAECLGEIWPPVAASVPALVRALKDSAAFVRKSAATALYHIEPQCPDAVAALIEAMHDSSIAHLAIETLGGIGPLAQTAIPALLAALDNKNLSFFAAGALGGIGPGASQAVPFLTRYLKSPKILMRRRVVEALGRIGPAAKRAAPDLMETFQDHEFFERANRSSSLFADCHVRNKLVGHPGHLQVDIATALWRICEEPLALYMLGERLNDGHASVRICALESLKELGLRAAPAAAEIARLAHDPEMWVRSKALDALEPLAALISGVVKLLIAACSDQKPLVRTTAANVLGRLGNLAAPAINSLLRLLSDPSQMVQTAAAMSLWHLERHEAAITTLINMLDEPGADKMLPAMKVENIGPPAKRALPALLRLTHSREIGLRCTAVRAIERIAGSPETN